MQNAPEPKLDHLYQEVILDHNKRPRNFKIIESPSRSSHGFNPLCGDDYRLQLVLDEKGVIQDIGFQGKGCAISKASASVMTSLVKGRPVQTAEELKSAFVRFMTSEEIDDALRLKVSRMRMFEGVREFPVRVKCATLIWRVLEDALKSETSSTHIFQE